MGHGKCQFSDMAIELADFWRGEFPDINFGFVDVHTQDGEFIKVAYGANEWPHNVFIQTKDGKRQAYLHKTFKAEHRAEDMFKDLELWESCQSIFEAPEAVGYAGLYWSYALPKLQLLRDDPQEALSQYWEWYWTNTKKNFDEANFVVKGIYIMFAMNFFFSMAYALYILVLACCFDHLRIEKNEKRKREMAEAAKAAAASAKVKPE